MENGEWRMENGEWRMENGKWKVENGDANEVSPAYALKKYVPGRIGTATLVAAKMRYE